MIHVGSFPPCIGFQAIKPSVSSSFLTLGEGGVSGALMASGELSVLDGAANELMGFAPPPPFAFFVMS